MAILPSLAPSGPANAVVTKLTRAFAAAPSASLSQSATFAMRGLPDRRSASIAAALSTASMNIQSSPWADSMLSTRREKLALVQYRNAQMPQFRAAQPRYPLDRLVHEPDSLVYMRVTPEAKGTS